MGRLVLSENERFLFTIRQLCRKIISIHYLNKFERKSGYMIKDKIKVVIWDLDDTLWKGTLAEGDDVQLHRK